MLIEDRQQTVLFRGWLGWPAPQKVSYQWKRRLCLDRPERVGIHLSAGPYPEACKVTASTVSQRGNPRPRVWNRRPLCLHNDGVPALFQPRCHCVRQGTNRAASLGELHTATSGNPGKHPCCLHILCVMCRGHGFTKCTVGPGALLLNTCSMPSCTYIGRPAP